ncbi:peptidoglycan DD-metalloendopeptidase family protein [Nocardia puris]|nr:peptidoglycan DD-metalloendopeptidase family protein [Nocardia puris]MBF6209473.1 peptidoglycan DD-metalloendopeptidase family protein [Nocardia puris]MBF6367839.1 peptidoglycan DD-metalloendopeptidase family protein [Nocardia puris]MBF6458613.1 peptidoglycan DD-metalloendopeptidase family protein [Nocardia puris]
MSAKGILWGVMSVVVGLMALVLVVVLPAVEDPCEGQSVLGPSGTDLPPLGGVAPGDQRAAAESTDAQANPTATATPSLAAGVGPIRRTMPMAAGTYTVSDVFGSRGGGHRGVDMAAADGTPIFSVSDGRVVAAGPASGFGNWIVVDSIDTNGRGYSAVYGHMWDHGVLVRVGDTVRAGQQIGLVGSAGESTGPHLHFEIVPGGRFTGGRQIDPMPWLDGAPTPDLGGAQWYSADPRCQLGFGTAGGALAAGKVPPELEIWYRRAGSLCPEITPSLLAAQGRQESGFRRGLTSPAGAQGLAQFLPGTATSTNPDDGRPYVIDADGNGVASVWDDGDAIIGQGRYMCAIAGKIKQWQAEGRVQGDLTSLTLAAYNAGEGAVLASGGMPNQYAAHWSETRPYVANILAMEAQYRAPGSTGRFSPGEGSPGEQVVEAAHDWLGTPYVWGGGGPQGPSDGGLDGPGLTAAAVFAASGGAVTLPRTAEQQWEAGREVSMSRAEPGDLVFHSFGPRGPAQVGVYAGDGRMIQSVPAAGAGAGGGVREVAVPGDARVRRVL